MFKAESCTSCGACCFSDAERYVPVTGADHARLGDDAEAATTFVGNRCYMRMHAGHCAALTVDARGHYCCSVYDRRPEVCRTLDRGSPACQVERERKSATAWLTAERLARGTH
jgi:Fe-S-cluster containining protein